MDSPLRGGKGLSTKEKITFLKKIVAILLITKPRPGGGGAKGFSGLSTIFFFLIAASLITLVQEL